MLCLCGFELYSRWVPLSFAGECSRLFSLLIRSHANCIRVTVNEIVEFNMGLQYVLFNSVSTFIFRRDSFC